MWTVSPASTPTLPSIKCASSTCRPPHSSSTKLPAGVSCPDSAGFRSGSVDYDAFEPVYRPGEYYRDNWGCVWYHRVGGLEGQVDGDGVAHLIDDQDIDGSPG